MQRWVVVCFLPVLLSAVFADECPNGGHCKDGQTCCQHPGKGYECCPFDKAECCGDHGHCCPAWMSCDMEKSRCVNATLSVPWAERTPTEQPSLSRSFRMIKSYIGEDDDNICPDQSRCPAEFSCLRALTKYGCCPLAQGIPCSDGKHCCPQGHSCSEDSRSCVKKDVKSTVLCSDGVSECPEESSCCKGADGQFGCCPMPQAVCCDDNVHCCPEGSLCDLETSKCVSVSSKKQLPMWAKFPARRRAEWEDQKEERHVTSEAAAGTENEEGKAESLETKTVNAILPGEHAGYVPCDKVTYCADGYTCCTTRQKQWFCCPVPNAVCCNDFAHCCPFHTTCNLVHFQCVHGNTSTPMSRNIPAITIAALSAPAEIQVTEPALSERTSDVPCNDTASCPDDTTCCSTPDGEWACCPAPNAVCCSDHMHCCPHGTTCDLVQQKCVESSNSLMKPMSRKTPAITTAAPPAPAEIQVTEPALNSVVSPGERTSDVPCNDTFACPDDTTCCATPDGEWACCPAPNAVCCSDHIHCCPQGTTCDLVHEMCVESSNSLTIPMSRKTPAITVTAAMQRGTGLAQSEQTDSEEDEGGEDGEDEEDVEDRVQCKSHKKSACPRNSTCCRSGCHKRRCCPMPHGTCCRDGKHCCPHGYKCCHRKQSCVKDDVEIPWYTKTPALSFPKQQLSVESQVTEPQTESEEGEEEDGDDVDDDDDDDVDEAIEHVHCGKNSTCPTCCGKKPHKFCCQHPNATCCHGNHCCPHGYKCCHRKRACVKDEVVIPWYTSVPVLSIPEPQPTVESQVPEPRPTEQTESEEDEAEDGDDDDNEDIEHGKHCKSHKNSTCPSCCEKERQKYCCPYPKATCCSDGKHCCPHKHRCHPPKQGCVKDGVVIPWHTAVEAPPTAEPVNVETPENEPSPPGPVWAWFEDEMREAEDDDVNEDDEYEAEDDLVHCDRKHTCPKDTTCCNSGNGWGCCPLPHAVCCSDGKHCCPHHYKCSTFRGACVRDDNVVIPWYTKLPARSDPDSQTDVKCSDGRRCPEYHTCCQLSSGEYGCCPMENAVCCNDRKHCCPADFGCDLSTGMCERAVVLEVEFVPLTPAVSEPLEESGVRCGRETCPDDNKCCMNRGMFYCCPYKTGMCCNNRYCCPPGQSCSKDGKCTSNSVSLWENWPFFFKRDEENPLKL